MTENGSSSPTFTAVKCLQNQCLLYRKFSNWIKFAVAIHVFGLNVDSMPEQLETQLSTVSLDLCLRKTETGKSHEYRFRKAPFWKCYLSAVKREVKFLLFGERFRKAPFSWRISADGTLGARGFSCAVFGVGHVSIVEMTLSFQISPAYNCMFSGSVWGWYWSGRRV